MRQQCLATYRAFWLSLALVLLAGAPALSQQPTWGEVRVAEHPVTVRQKPDANAIIARTLHPGDKVRVDFVGSTGWGALFDVSEPLREEARTIGYAEVKLLTPLAQAPGAAQGKAAPAHSASAARNPADAGQIRQVEARTEVRKDRSLQSPVVAVLTPGEDIQTGFLRDGFVAVFRMNDPATSETTAIGYIPAGMARLQPKAQPQAKVPAARSTPRVEGKSAPAPELKGEVKGEQGLLSGQAPGSKPGDKPGDKEDPVRITSDRMVYNQAENAVVFLGNVHGTQADMAIWSAKLTAYFTEKPKGKDAPKDKAPAQDKQPGNDFGDKIERIVAEGNVRMVSGKNEGACEKLTYYVQESMLRMDGNPILREGQNTVRGDIIKFYVRENRSEVLSGTQRRVEAIFNSQGAQK